MEFRDTLDGKLVFNIELPVLDQWDFKVFDVIPQGKVIKLETDVGSKCLEIRTLSPNAVFRIFLMSEHLSQHGLKRIPRFIRTRYGEPYIKTGKGYYWVSDWFHGRPVNYQDQNDMVKSARKLAEFHMASKGFYLPGEEEATYHQNYRGIKFLNMACQIVDLKSQIRKPAFFRESLRIMAERMIYAAKILTGSGYGQLREKYKKEQGFCHGAFNRDHLIMGNSGEVYLTGLSHWNRDIRLWDLTDFLFSVGQENQWDRQLFQKIITNYHQICPLLPLEMNFLQGYLFFPFGYWELLQDLAQKNAGGEETKDRLAAYWEQEEKKEKCLIDLWKLKEGMLGGW